MQKKHSLLHAALIASAALFLVLLLSLTTACSSGSADAAPVDQSAPSVQSVQSVAGDNPSLITLKPRGFAMTTRGVPLLRLHGDVCSVQVQQSNSSAITVQVTIRHYQGNKMPIITYNVTSDRGMLTINERLPVRSNTNTPGDNVDFTIAVPRHMDLGLNTKVGSIDVSDVSGPMVLATTTGSITTSQVQLSGHAALTTNVGSITFDGTLARGGNYRMQSRIGSIDATFPGSPSLQIDAQTRVGSVSSDFSDIEVDNNSAQGSMGNAPYANLTLITQIGSISLSQG